MFFCEGGWKESKGKRKKRGASHPSFLAILGGAPPPKKINSFSRSAGGPRGPGPKNKSLPPHPPDYGSYDVCNFMTNIVDIVPRARKAVIEISLSLILATLGCTFLPRAREGQCRQLGNFAH